MNDMAKTKDDIFSLLETVSKEDLIRALCNWFSTADLQEFAEFLQTEGLIENDYFTDY